MHVKRIFLHCKNKRTEVKTFSTSQIILFQKSVTEQFTTKYEWHLDSQTYSGYFFFIRTESSRTMHCTYMKMYWIIWIIIYCITEKKNLSFTHIIISLQIEFQNCMVNDIFFSDVFVSHSHLRLETLLEFGEMKDIFEHYIKLKKNSSIISIKKKFDLLY